MTLDSINSADPTKPTVKPVPYVGVQFVAIPEFQGLAPRWARSSRRRWPARRRRRSAGRSAGRCHRRDEGRGLHPVTERPGGKLPARAGSSALLRTLQACKPTSRSAQAVAFRGPGSAPAPPPEPEGRHPMSTQSSRTRRPPDGGALGRPAVRLDDRAPGDDAVLFVPVLPADVARPDAAGSASPTTPGSSTRPISGWRSGNTLALVGGVLVITVVWAS
jgi:hypothetical protein